MKRLFLRNLWALAAVVSLVLTGCTSTAESEPAAERDAGKYTTLKEIEVCFMNDFPDVAVDLRKFPDTKDGSGRYDETRLRPGNTACIQSKEGFQRIRGELTPTHDGQIYSYRFLNPLIHYPLATFMIGQGDGTRNVRGPGFCQRFGENETHVLDSGTTRLEVTRLTDTEFKRFNVVLSPSQSTVIPESCSLAEMID